jgi:hypothetical protein
MNGWHQTANDEPEPDVVCGPALTPTRGSAAPAIIPRV